MKHPLSRKVLSTLLALCLFALPTLSVADTYLPDGPVTHVDFTLGAKVHADGFPQSKAHLADWETFLNKLDVRGSMDALAMLTPDSRVYLNGALRLNGKDQVPFVYDGYHSYRYLTSPALGDEVLFFQMHNFLEFMLKPYYYMELPTQYLGLLMYPEAAYAIGDEYYTPIAEMIEQAKQGALNGESDNLPQSAQSQADAALSQEDADADVGEDSEADLTDSEAADVATDATVAADATPAPSADPTATAVPTATPVPTPTPMPVVAADGTVTFRVPYEALYEQCENLDLYVNDDLDLERVYFFVTSLLTDLYASDMTLSTLGALENVLDYLDPNQQGMTVVETADSMTCTLGGTQLFSRKTDASGAANIDFTLPTPDGYQVVFHYLWQPQAVGANLKASIALMEDDAQSILLTADAIGLPREGELGGKGQVTFTVSGKSFDAVPAPLTLAFDWARDASALPYTLNLTLDWIHPQTQKPAVSLNFIGTFAATDKSVFVEGKYPQNDFFSLNETFLEGYKERLIPSLALKFAPIALETPAGVINDLYTFLTKTNILVSFME